MSLPSLLDALADRVLGPTNGSLASETAQLRLKKRFIEHILLGNTHYDSGISVPSDISDPILALEGIALTWNLTERFDHATAMRLLLERIKTSTSIPNGLFYHIRIRTSDRATYNSEIGFSEHSSVLEFLYRLYTLKHSHIRSSSISFDPQTHKLTPYAELLLKQQDSGLNGDRKEMGWYFSSGACLSSSSRQNSNQTELSINDTTFDALWGALLSPQSAEMHPNRPRLKHPVFSVPLRHELKSFSSIMPSSNLPAFNLDDPTHIHKAEGLGSMFGMLRFAHPSVVPKWFGKDSEAPEGSAVFPRMRLNLEREKEHRLELPEPEIEGDVPPWLKMQRWKPQSILETLSLSSSDHRKSIESIEKPNLPLVEGKRVTVADWLERTWHGAAGPSPPWKTPEADGGLLIEEEVLEWKDRLIYRARLLNVVSETIEDGLRSYLDHIKSLFGGSYPTATAFCNAARRFINFWRGELLFAGQNPPPKCDSLETLLGEQVLDDVLPRIFKIDENNLDDINTQNRSYLARSKHDTDDFDKSFCRIVSTTGSCTQIVHLYHLIGQILEVKDSGTQYPIGMEPINKLTQICIRTEMDPIITFGISRQILSLTLVPFSRFFSEWLFWGVIPSHADWMIQNKKSPSFASSHHSSSSSPFPTPRNAQEYRYSSFASPVQNTTHQHWLEPFSIQFSHVPSFLRHHEELVLKTGVLVRIYREIQTSMSSKLHSKTNNKTKNRHEQQEGLLPLLRPIWSLSQLGKYYSSIQEYIGIACESSGENWMEGLEENGDGDARCVSVEQSLHDSFVVPLQIQFDQVSPAVCRCLVEDFGLLKVMDRLKSDYFGNLVSAAFEALPLGVDLLDESASSHSLDRLRVIFCENIQGHFKKLGYRLALEKIPVCSGIDVLDNIVIEPTYIEWPLSILITKHDLEQYNAVFVLLTKMTRTRAALNAVWTNLSSATRLAHRLRSMSQKRKSEAHLGESVFEIDWEATFQVLHKASLFCHQLQHFWSQLFYFIANQVGNTCFFQLEQSVKNATHFEQLVEAHQDFVGSIMKSSLLTPNCRALMIVVEKTIHVVHKFRQQVRHSLADPSKWEMRMRKEPISKSSTTNSDILLGLGILEHPSPSPSPSNGAIPSTKSSTLLSSSSSSLHDDIESPSALNESVFEQADYQPDHLDTLIQTSKHEFSKCMKFLMAVLLKLLSRGYEPRMASLVASLNWNKFYFAGSEAVSEETH